jgi:hypothetical protein
MCGRCEKNDTLIAGYRWLQQGTRDERVAKAAAFLIRRLESEKFALHPEGEVLNLHPEEVVLPLAPR